MVTSAECTAHSGTYQGDNTACTSTTCPQPAVGACCIAASAAAGAHCTVGTQAACTTAGGTYGGDQSTCVSANCPTSCPCDWNHDGVLSTADVLLFITDWLAGNADFNNDGVTNNVDLAAFLDCFMNPPTGCVKGHGGGNGGNGGSTAPGGVTNGSSNVAR